MKLAYSLCRQLFFALNTSGDPDTISGVGNSIAVFIQNFSVNILVF
jgi:hypothetical protein